jgi:hypothetical protein
MLDTVTCTTARRLLPPVAAALTKSEFNLIPGWNFELHSGAADNHTGWTLIGTHNASGIYVRGLPWEIRSWTASLPRVLHGFNGIQIKSDTEQAAAVQGVYSLLSEISEPTGLAETFRRVDIALNLAHPDPQLLVQALRNARHPRIRRETQCYANGNLRYPGTELVFTAYWKRPPVKTGAKQKAWNTPRVLRLEIQLKKADKIAEVLSLEEPPIFQLPPTRAIYTAFRDFMMGFPPSLHGTGRCEMASLMALCEANKVTLPGGESVSEWHRRSVKPSAHSSMRRKVASLTQTFLGVDWSQLLPENAFPQTVDVRADGSTQVVPLNPFT